MCSLFLPSPLPSDTWRLFNCYTAFLCLLVLRQPQHDHHRHHQYEHEEKRPTSSGSSSSSHCTPKGTAGNSTPTSNVSYSSSDGATARSKPSAAPSLRVGVASRKRGSDGERQQYGDGSRQKGMPCDSSRGPSVTERPARWAAKARRSKWVLRKWTVKLLQYAVCGVRCWWDV